MTDCNKYQDIVYNQLSALCQAAGGEATQCNIWTDFYAKWKKFMNVLDQRILLFFSLNSSCNQQFVIFEIAFFSLDGLFSIRDHLIFSRELFVYPSKYYLFTYTPRAIWTFESMNSQEHYHIVRNAGQQPPKLKRPVSCKPACFVVIAFMGIIDNQNITKKGYVVTCPIRRPAKTGKDHEVQNFNHTANRE